MASQVYFEKGQTAVPITYAVCVHSEQCFLDSSSLCILYQQHATWKQEYEKDSAS